MPNFSSGRWYGTLAFQGHGPPHSQPLGALQSPISRVNAASAKPPHSTASPSRLSQLNLYI